MYKQVVIHSSGWATAHTLPSSYNNNDNNRHIYRASYMPTKGYRNTARWSLMTYEATERL